MAMKATRSDLGIWVAARSRSPASLSAPGRFWAVPSRCCPALFDEPPQPGTTRLTITRPCTGETRIGLRNHAGRRRRRGIRLRRLGRLGPAAIVAILAIAATARAAGPDPIGPASPALADGC